MKVTKINVYYKDEELVIEDSGLEVSIESMPDEAEPCPSVIWRFHGIEELESQGYSPLIEFKDSWRGPFTSICQMNGQVTGNGNKGDGTLEYSYHVSLVNRSGPEVQTIRSVNKATLLNEVTLDQPNTSPFVEVSLRRDEGRLLYVETEAIGRTPGEAVVWKVIEVPEECEDWFPRVVFDDPVGDQDPHYGPFTSWQIDNRTVVGSGHRKYECEPSLEENCRRFKYHFELVSKDGETQEFRASPDPTVDDEGIPFGGEVARAATLPTEPRNQ